MCRTSMGFLSSIHTSECVQSLHTEFCHYTKESRGHVQISTVMGTNFMDVVEYVTLIFFAAVLCYGNKELAKMIEEWDRRLDYLRVPAAIRKFTMVWVCMSQGEAMSLGAWCVHQKGTGHLQ